MTATKCVRCGQYWSHNTGQQQFSVITRFCPTCIPAMLPVMGVATMQRRAAS